MPAVGAWGEFSSGRRRVHERISRLQRKGDWPVRTSRILSQQSGSVVGYLRNLSGRSCRLWCASRRPNPP